MKLINNVHHIIIECDRETETLDIDLGSVLIINTESDRSVKYDVSNSYREDNYVYCILTDEDCEELFADDSKFDLTEEDIDSNLTSELFVTGESEFEILSMRLILRIYGVEVVVPCTLD